MVVDQAPHESGFAVIFKEEQMSFAGQTECRRDPWTSLSTMETKAGFLLPRHQEGYRSENTGPNDGSNATGF